MIITTNLIPKPLEALTVWPFIFVRPGKESDESLIARQMAHYKDQAWKTPYWLLRYFFSKQFRFNVELNAYKAQVAAGGITVGRAAYHLTKYGLGISYTQAATLLRKKD